jgi:multiple sugar transport system ATP-binding protein
VDAPETLYERPVNLFVAGFIGSPAMNMLEATLEQSNGRLEAVVDGTRLPLVDETLQRHPALPTYAGKPVILGIRPEDLEDAALATGEGPRLKGDVELREALGSEVLVHFGISAKQAVTEHVLELAEDVGDDRAMAQLEEGDVPARTTLVGRFGARSRVKERDQIDVTVDPRSLHFFDPDTGLGIYDQQTTKEG